MSYPDFISLPENILEFPNLFPSEKVQDLLQETYQEVHLKGCGLVQLGPGLWALQSLYLANGEVQKELHLPLEKKANFFIFFIEIGVEGEVFSFGEHCVHGFSEGGKVLTGF